MVWLAKVQARPDSCRLRLCHLLTMDVCCGGTLLYLRFA
uniref:Uncharacterized protein n=1 Tax=Anguilla anguilla TaxID=7936 RepID=A0A0E9V1G6_ANGAN